MKFSIYVLQAFFAGEEAICFEGKSQYAMNYMGRILGQQFSGDFLKEALRKADKEMPYRGPEYYKSGEYLYKCNCPKELSTHLEDMQMLSYVDCRMHLQEIHFLRRKKNSIFSIR